MVTRRCGRRPRPAWSPGRSQARSTSSTASSPTPRTRWVESSWTRGSVHPAYQPAATPKLRRARPGSARPPPSGRRWPRGRGAARTGGEGAHQRGLARAGRRTAPAGRAPRARCPGCCRPCRSWSSAGRPPARRPSGDSSELAGRVGGARRRVAGGAAVRAAPGARWDVSASRSSVGRTPATSVTSQPVTTQRGDRGDAPTWCAYAGGRRRRGAGSGRGASAPTTPARAAARAGGRTPVVETSRCRANRASAVCSSRSAPARVSPASRAISSRDSVVSWVSSSSRRWAAGSLPRASRVARDLGVDARSRCQRRAVWRRCACAQACGRTHGLGVLEPRDLAPVVPGRDEGVADRGAGRGQVAGEREGLHQQAVARVLVEGVEPLGIGHGCGPRYEERRGTRANPAWQPPDRPRRAGDDGRAMTSLLPVRPTSPARRRAPPRRRRRRRRPAPPRAARRRWAGSARPARRSWCAWPAGSIGWFLTDAGAHGAPRDGLRVGATGWLMAHGSGVTSRAPRSPRCRWA